MYNYGKKGGKIGGKSLYVIEKYQTPEGKKEFFSIRLINATFSIALTQFANAYSIFLMAEIVHTQGFDRMVVVNGGSRLIRQL